VTQIAEIADHYVQRLAELSPNAATQLGIPGFDDRLSDFSPDGFEALQSHRQDTLQALDAAAIETENDRIARAVMREQLANQSELHDAGDHFRGLAILNSPLQSIRSVFDQMPRASAADWETIATRLGHIPQALAGYRRTLDTGAERRLVPAQRQVSECATQCDTWSNGETGFFAGVADACDKADPAPGLATRVRDAATAAAAAYVDMGRYLREVLYTNATERDAVGPDRYGMAARAFSGATLDLERTYAWGWDQLYGVEAEMRATAGKVKPGATIAAAVDLLESDLARCIQGVEPFRNWMQEFQDRTIAELNGKHFDIPGPIRKIEAMIAPPGGALAMYYTGPSEDFSRPGRTWYPTGGKTRFPLWGEVSIAYHEGVPGHHLERASVKYQAETLTRYQRLFGTSGYVEGWGLYAERLMAELGYLENPDYYLGMLRAQALRSVRIVVDIGMHLELEIPATEPDLAGKRWTPDLGNAFTATRSQFPPDFTASEVTRYLGMPGQAISYKIGERAWLESREAVKRRRGAAFDLKQFHADAFRLGPMGLDQMRREMASL